MAAPEPVLSLFISLEAQTCLEQTLGLPPSPDKAHPSLLQGAHWERRGSLPPLTESLNSLLGNHISSMVYGFQKKKPVCLPPTLETKGKSFLSSPL